METFDITRAKIRADRLGRRKRALHVVSAAAVAAGLGYVCFGGLAAAGLGAFAAFVTRELTKPLGF